MAIAIPAAGECLPNLCHEHSPWILPNKVQLFLVLTIPAVGECLPYLCHDHSHLSDFSCKLPVRHFLIFPLQS